MVGLQSKIDSSISTSQKFCILSVTSPHDPEVVVEQLRKHFVNGIVTHTYTTRTDESEIVVPTGSLLLQFVPGLQEAARRALLNKFSLSVVSNDKNMYVYG